MSSRVATQLDSNNYRLFQIYILQGGPKLAKGDQFWQQKWSGGTNFGNIFYQNWSGWTDFDMTAPTIKATGVKWRLSANAEWQEAII